jgi:hypothetical protein
MNCCEYGFFVITIRPSFDTVQPIVFHPYPLLKLST